MSSTDSFPADSFPVRELQAHDLPLLRSVLPDWTPVGLQPQANASAHRWLVLLQRDDAKELPAGIAEYQQILDEGHLLGIATVPALRGRGLGMHLLHATLDEMRRRGCTRCLLEVRRSNVAARALYERAQFTLDGLRKDYYPVQASQPCEDALLYSLLL